MACLAVAAAAEEPAVVACEFETTAERCTAAGMQAALETLHGVAVILLGTTASTCGAYDGVAAVCSSIEMSASREAAWL